MGRFGACTLWIAAFLVAGCAPELPRRSRGLERLDVDGRSLVPLDGGYLESGVPPSSPQPPLPPAPAGCGDGHLAGGEVCDGDVRSCSSIDPGYSGGAAPCNASCSGYDLSACVKPQPQPTLDQALASISLTQLKQDLSTLASDGYGGRLPGTAGDQQTRAHAVQALKSAGVAAGNAGSYEQPFSVGGAATANIVGTLPGVDPAVKDEVVVVGAHHDHLGTTSHPGCANAGGSPVCNGADDNASGAAAVLAIARALAQLKGQNRRRLVFVLFGGEEEGLVGSSHYVVDAPIFALAKTQYMINLDMLGYSTGTVQALGATRSPTAAGWITDAAGKEGLTAQTTFSAGGGSDHYPFAMSGVPYVFFHTPGSPCYHATCDTADKIHYTEYEKITRAVARLVWTVSQASGSPRDDFQQPSSTSALLPFSDHAPPTGNGH